MDQRVSQKQPKVGKHVPRSHGNLPKLHFVHYSSRGSRFSKGFASDVLKGTNKDFSRAAFSHFSLPHFQTYLWASHSYRGDSLEQNNLHSSQLTGRKLPNILSYNTYSNLAARFHPAIIVPRKAMNMVEVFIVQMGLHNMQCI